ncbi:hypothetical protein Gpo141_00002984 [Globisporangium polare]
MVLVSADAFLAKVAELYEQPVGASKGSVAISCKSVPVKKLAKSGSRDKALADAEHALLFRVCKYGNNKHKKKYSTTITAAGHAQFHAALSQIIKTKVDVASLKDAALHPGAKRVVTSKKAAA